MAGSLTPFLQRAFVEHAPRGWRCTTEQAVVPMEVSRSIGYTPRADVMMQAPDGATRIWVEFEVSRADPVANHAKFAVAHLHHPFSASDVFVSMVSRHVDGGRANLAVQGVLLLRSVGVQAFQTVLFPQLDGAGLKAANHADEETLDALNLHPRREVERVLHVTRPALEHDGHRIHFASNTHDVAANIRGYNNQLRQAEHADRWGRRRICYFAFDPASGLFAPSKFAAFLPAPRAQLAQRTLADLQPLMTVPMYVQLDESDSRFDGNVAWKHLVNRLGYQAMPRDSQPALRDAFAHWLHAVDHHITLGSAVTLLVPPG